MEYGRPALRDLSQSAGSRRVALRRATRQHDVDDSVATTSRYQSDGSPRVVGRMRVLSLWPAAKSPLFAASSE